jgi:hypothetical protein
MSTLWIFTTLRTIIFFAVLLFISSCRKPEKVQATGLFKDAPVSVPISPDTIEEASGIADSKSQPGNLWVQEDSGNPPELHLVSHNGMLKKSVYIKGATNRDWEDMLIANGPSDGVNYIYISDAGDNSLQHDIYRIYRFPEPVAGMDTVYNPDVIPFRYPDGSHDAEAMLADLASKDLYLITKRDQASRIYKLPYPQSVTAVQTAVYIGALPFTGVVSAAVSSDNREILLKTYLNMYYVKRSGSQSLEDALKNNPVTVSYKPEAQGEAVCFKNDNSGFFTLSEKGLAIAVALNFYRRN